MSDKGWPKRYLPVILHGAQADMLEIVGRFAEDMLCYPVSGKMRMEHNKVSYTRFT